MTRCVADASAFGPLLIPDEEHDLIAGLTEMLSNDGVVVPQHWPLEIGNLAIVAARRNRIEVDEARDVLAKLRDANIIVDDATGDRAWSHTFALASAHGLTIYDAAYLELAIRSHLPIATRDTHLARAARAENVAVLGA